MKYTADIEDCILKRLSGPKVGILIPKVARLIKGDWTASVQEQERVLWFLDTQPILLLPGGADWS